MWIECELVFRHYQPSKIVSGMLFMNDIYPNNPDKQVSEVWEITEDYLDVHVEDEFLIYENGYPVQPFIIQREANIIITPEEIGWWDAGEITEELIPIGIKEYNFILREFDGWLEILVDEEILETHGIMQPLLEDDLVILRFDQEEDDDDEEEE